MTKKDQFDNVIGHQFKFQSRAAFVMWFNRNFPSCISLQVSNLSSVLNGTQHTAWYEEIIDQVLQNPSVFKEKLLENSRQTQHRIDDVEKAVLSMKNLKISPGPFAVLESPSAPVSPVLDNSTELSHFMNPLTIRSGQFININNRTISIGFVWQHNGESYFTTTSHAFLPIFLDQETDVWIDQQHLIVRCIFSSTLLDIAVLQISDKRVFIEPMIPISEFIRVPESAVVTLYGKQREGVVVKSTYDGQFFEISSTSAKTDFAKVGDSGSLVCFQGKPIGIMHSIKDRICIATTVIPLVYEAMELLGIITKSIATLFQLCGFSREWVSASFPTNETDIDHFTSTNFVEAFLANRSFRTEQELLDSGLRKDVIDGILDAANATNNPIEYFVWKRFQSALTDDLTNEDRNKIAGVQDFSPFPFHHPDRKAVLVMRGEFGDQSKIALKISLQFRNTLSLDPSQQLFYHATNWASAHSILVGGINCNKGLPECNFSNSDGFYVTKTLGDAIDWCEKMTRYNMLIPPQPIWRSRDAAILIFTLSKPLLSYEEKYKNFSSANDEWKAVVAAFRSGKLNRFKKYNWKLIQGLQAIPPYENAQTNNQFQLCCRDSDIAEELFVPLGVIIFPPLPSCSNNNNTN